MERIRLADEYSRLITEFNNRLEFIKRASAHERNDDDWISASTALLNAQTIWEALQNHVAEHRCLELTPRKPDRRPPTASRSLLEDAALATSDPIVITDDNRVYVEVNEAAAQLLGLPRNEIIGRTIDEFFPSVGNKTTAEAWSEFLSKGAQVGFVERDSRRFEFRSKAHFLPGLHLSILREVSAES